MGYELNIKDGSNKRVEIEPGNIIRCEFLKNIGLISVADNSSTLKIVDPWKNDNKLVVDKINDEQSFKKLLKSQEINFKTRSADEEQILIEVL